MFQHIQNYGVVVVALLIVSGLSAAEDNAAFEQSNLYPVEYDDNITTSEFVGLALDTLDKMLHHNLCQLTPDECDQIKDYSLIYTMACLDLRIAMTKEVLPNIDPNDKKDFEDLINKCYIRDEIAAFNRLLDNANVSLETKTVAKIQLEETIKKLLRELIDILPWPFSRLKNWLNKLLDIINEISPVIMASGGENTKITTTTSGTGLSEAGLTIMTVPLLMAGAILIVRRRRRKAA